MGIADEMRKARKLNPPYTPPVPTQLPKVTVKKIEYAYVPADAFDREHGLYVALQKFTSSNTPVTAGWKEARSVVKEWSARLPTNFEWSRARKYAEKFIPELERDMTSIRPGSDNREWTDTLIDFDNEPPLEITEAVFEPYGSEGMRVGERLKGGKMRPLPFLPKQPGYVETWDTQTELPSSAGMSDSMLRSWYDNAGYSVVPSGVRAVVRGSKTPDSGLGGRTARFSVDISDNLYDSSTYLRLHFRTVVDEDAADKLVLR